MSRASGVQSSSCSFAAAFFLGQLRGNFQEGYCCFVKKKVMHGLMQAKQSGQGSRRALRVYVAASALLQRVWRP